MDPAVHLDHLRADCAALLAAYRTDPTAPAWEGLGWDRGELLEHLANVHARVRAQLVFGPTERIRYSTVELVAGGPGLGDSFESGAAELVARLEGMDLDRTWPTWAGPLPGTFFPRRMAQEAAVHRWDGIGGHIDRDLAVDGVDELLELFVPRLPAERFDGRTGSLHLHATDADGEWLVHLGADGITFEHGHAKGDVALRGTAADLLLWSWNRVPVDDRFQVFGDADLLETWRTVVTF